MNSNHYGGSQVICTKGSVTGEIFVLHCLVKYSNNGNGFFQSLISSESESDEESDGAEENETELESGEHKQGKMQICDYRL